MHICLIWLSFSKSHYRLDCMNVIAGDFNCPKISWDNLQCSTDRTHQLSLSCVIDCGLTQVVDFNTRLQNVLDIVLTDEPQRILKVTSKPPLGQSDHDMIKFDVMVYDQLSPHDSTPLLRYQWHLMDCVAANNLSLIHISEPTRPY